MMNEALANFIGKEGFNWWIGQVENDGAKFWNAELNDGETQQHQSLSI